MGHKCGNCGESAPILFGFCPECDSNLDLCQCTQCWATLRGKGIA